MHGDIRFIAHNDMVRMFSRACARAGLPVAFTQGFNPRARLSLPFPRPVGQQSDAERLLVDLGEPLPATSLIERLQPQMPPGIDLRHATTLATTDSCPPRWVRYRVDCPPADSTALAATAQHLLDSETVVITRVRHKDKRSKVVNIRPFIDAIQVDECGLDVSVFLTDSGAATPTEVCGALGMEADAINHLVRRAEIQWQTKPTQPTPNPTL